MVNDIANRGSTEVSNAEWVNSLIVGVDNSRAETPVIGGGKPILRLLKSGIWVFGQTDDPVQEGSRWAVNPRSVMHGFTCWSDYPGNTKNELLGERMVPVTERKPVKPEPIGGFEWKEQRVFDVKCMTGDDEGTEVVFKTASIGGMRAFDVFLAELGKQARKDPGHLVAILEFEVTSYQHVKYGQIFNPVLNIVGWADMDGNPAGSAAVAAPAAAPAAAAKPVRTRKASLKGAPTQEAAETAERVEYTAPQATQAMPQRAGAAPRRQRPSATA